MIDEKQIIYQINSNYTYSGHTYNLCHFFKKYQDINQQINAYIFPKLKYQINRGIIQSQTLGGSVEPAFSHPIVSTGASPEHLILRIPSSVSSQCAGDLTISYMN